MNSVFSVFRKVAFVEGVSYVAILLNILVVKKMNPELGQSLVYPIGLAHGLLFIAYGMLAIFVMKKYRRSFVWLLIAGVMSVIPLGTFFMEKRWKKEEMEFLKA